MEYERQLASSRAKTDVTSISSLNKTKTNGQQEVSASTNRPNETSIRESEKQDERNNDQSEGRGSDGSEGDGSEGHEGREGRGGESGPKADNDYEYFYDDNGDVDHIYDLGQKDASGKEIVTRERNITKCK